MWRSTFPIWMLCMLMGAFMACNDNPKTTLSSAQSKLSTTTNKVVSDTALIITDSSLLNKGANYRLIFYYLDSLGYGHPLSPFSKDTNVLPLTSPVWLLYANAKSHKIPYLVRPGDTLYLVSGGGELAILTTKRSIGENQELRFFPDLIAITGELFDGGLLSRYVDRFRDPIKVLDTLKITNEKRLAYLDSVYGAHAISDSFYTSAKSIIESAALVNMSAILVANKSQLEQTYLPAGNKETKQKNAYTVLFDTLEFKTKALPFQYNYMQSLLLTNMMNMGTGHKWDGAIKDLPDLKGRMAYVNDHFSGLQKDYLLSNLMAKASLFAHIKVPSATVLKYDELTKDKAFKNRVHRLLQHQSIAIDTLGSDNNLVRADLITKKSMLELVLANKGKLILLDFWASWCKPCRVEIPYLKDLEKRYADKEIAFFAISIDSDVDGWVKAMEQEGIKNKSSWLLTNTGKASILSQYKIQTIPRYILLGKDGKVIDADAPRPSDKALTQLMDRYL